DPADAGIGVNDHQPRTGRANGDGLSNVQVADPGGFIILAHERAEVVDAGRQQDDILAMPRPAFAGLIAGRAVGVGGDDRLTQGAFAVIVLFYIVEVVDN